MKVVSYLIRTTLGMVAVLAGATLPAYGVTSITTCNPGVAAPGGSLITAPGNYSLEADLTASENCIVITASNVSLALNNHVIVGTPGTFDSVGITVGTFNSRLHHVGISGPGLVKGFGWGIFLRNTDYAQVSLVTASSNKSYGISAGDSTFLTIASNVVVQNDFWGMGIQADNSSVTGNEVSGNGVPPDSLPAGGLLVSGTGNTISNNVISGNGSFPESSPLIPPADLGLFVYTTNSRIFGNVVDGNRGVGIAVFGSGNQIFKNKAIGNLDNDLQDGSANCGINLWADNTFFTRDPASCVK